MTFRFVILVSRLRLFQEQSLNLSNLNSIHKIRNYSTIFSKSLKSMEKLNNKIIFKDLFNSNYSINELILKNQRRLTSQYNQISKLWAKSHNKNIVLYATAFVCLVLGATYASVPLYRIYCQSTGKGGKPFIDEKANQKIINMKRADERKITVTFSAETTSQMSWNFKPTQPEIGCFPGETVLAFFTAKNPLDTPVDGIATYTVQPFEAGSYLNKIQCFCFEEQRLNPHEEVDLPVFFYIDPEYVSDPKLENVDHIVLSYTFFEAKKGLKLPTFMTSQIKPPQQTVESSLTLQRI